MLGNLLGGLSMFALAWALVRRVHAWRAAPRHVRRAAGLGAVLWLVQAAVGALSGTAASAWTATGLAHLALAAVGLPVAAGLGIALLRGAHRGEGLALLAVAALQAVLGGLALLAEGPAPVVLVHNAAAAVGLALLCGVALGRAPVYRGPLAVPVSGGRRAR
jgi:heme A synthase